MTFNLTNTGTVAGRRSGAGLPGLPAGTGEPPKRLVGWQKVFLQPGAQQSVTIEVDENDSSHPLSYWDVGSNGWRAAPGDYAVYVGNSSAAASLALAGSFHVGP